MKKKSAHNKGKKLYWWCKHMVRNYDDWGKWVECTYPYRGWNKDLCEYRKLTKQCDCPMFERGSDCHYLSKREVEDLNRR